MTRYTYIGAERFPLPAQQDEPKAAPMPEAPKKRKTSRAKMEAPETPEVPNETTEAPSGSSVDADA